MKQAIAGVQPAQVEEAAVMTVWPSVSACSIGRFFGRLYAIGWPDVSIFRLGNLFALLSVATLLPTAMYFYRLLVSDFDIRISNFALGQYCDCVLGDSVVFWAI